MATKRGEGAESEGTRATTPRKSSTGAAGAGSTTRSAARPDGAAADSGTGRSGAGTRGSAAKGGTTGAKATGAAGAAGSGVGKAAGKAATTRTSSRGAAAGTGATRAGAAGGTKAASTGGARKAAGGKKPDLRRDLRDFASTRPQGWSHDDWLQFLDHLQGRGHNISDRDQIGSLLERERLSLALEKIPGVGPARVRTIAERYGYLWRLKETDADQLSREADIPRNVAEKVLAGLRH